jgi:hypothetical protein
MIPANEQSLLSSWLQGKGYWWMHEKEQVILKKLNEVQENTESLMKLEKTICNKNKKFSTKLCITKKSQRQILELNNWLG